jgi:small subunit ribosomal protein S17
MTTASKETLDRGRRHQFKGVVVSDKADKTRVVLVEWLYRHPRYDKTMRKRSKFYVHDENNESKAGDTIEIMATRPLSKLKRWRLVRIVEKARIPQMAEPAKEAA